MEMVGGLRRGVDEFFCIWIEVNVVLFLFNLVGVGGVDGYGIIEDVVWLGVCGKMREAES